MEANVAFPASECTDKTITKAVILFSVWRRMQNVWESNRERQFWEVVVQNHFDDKLE